MLMIIPKNDDFNIQELVGGLGDIFVHICAKAPNFAQMLPRTYYNDKVRAPEPATNGVAMATKSNMAAA